MSRDKRIFVEKRPGFDTEAESLRRELNSNLGLDIKKLRLLSVYDLFGFDTDLLEESAFRVFAEPATDSLLYDVDLSANPYLAMEYLPGQFDQRASSAEACVKLIRPDADIRIRSGKLLIFDSSVSEKDIEKISSFCINPVESREKDLTILSLPQDAVPVEEEVMEGFRDISPQQAPAYCASLGLAMNGDDLMEIVKYFRKEGRDPNRTELRILDTYWSDHCRHTTFTTHLTDIEVAPSENSGEIKDSLDLWNRIRHELGRDDKPLTLMDLATIGARYLRHKGLLPDLEVSEENNACSIFIDVDVDGKPEKWLLQFKNETHNHPTEIEPFGGASTCLGGAVRDPLSGRAYVYQAMRVTGAGDIHAQIEDTLPGKLPQRVISTRAAAGYSSYGNQLGLATTHVREIYHPGYTAKRMEVGAVVGAVRAADVRRESPAPGDVILMLGGRTGRDGIGGATGSSKKHTVDSLEECGSEVQKGNPPEERKIQRLFRRPETTSLIKKSNDFGAGGVSVAIGELADGLDIYLDRVPTKYSGLSATDLAISESQERMAVVVERKDMEKFMALCAEENIEVTHVADVTDTGRMRMMHGDKVVADLRREFIDSAGAPHFSRAVIEGPASDSHKKDSPSDIRTLIKETLSNPNVTSQKGLVEMFDSTIGASTVLLPFGGDTRRSETQVSVQKLPVGAADTDTASLMAFGFNPDISSRSPYHGAMYAVTEAVAKAVAAGADWRKLRFSYQEYFQRLTDAESWGKPLAALLGALRMQIELGLPSIGGKDSMSGTFGDINVPPTLIAFGVAPVKASKIVSTDFKKPGSSIYLLSLPEGTSPDTDFLKRAYSDYHARILKGEILSAFALGYGGVAEAVAKMAFGNGIGARIEVPANRLAVFDYGAILIETDTDLPEEFYRKIGETTSDETLVFNGVAVPIEEAYEWNRLPFTEIYPDKTDLNEEIPVPPVRENTAVWKGEKTDHPTVYLPVFPGTNCDYDMAEAFQREGAVTRHGVFRNLSPEDIDNSVREMAREIDDCHILAISGGFSAGDEPDGSGKFIANVLMNATVKDAILRLLHRGGLILGICNGFQALVKSGLLPFGKIGELSPDSPTLARNDINRHISQMVTTRVSSVASPWLDGFTPGELFTVAASHGEGKFMASHKLARQLAENGQIAFQYADPATGLPTMDFRENPNGSTMAIEGIISPDGLILGKMAHSERHRPDIYRNVPAASKHQNIFRNAINYFK